jgi:DNA-directed RNA polymerase subunit RPC12/RpoP
MSNAESIAARGKYACPACGAEATWHPAKQSLVCGYCGTVSPATLSADGSLVREHDLARVLRGAPESERGWQAQRTMVKCQSCQAVSAFDAARVGQRCDFCGSSALVEYDEIQEIIRPESVLPFRVSETQVRDSIRRWYGSHWLAPGRLKARALTDTVHGVYLPYWTFDARVEADWQAQAGYYYWDSESYRDSEGNLKTRQVRKVRWEPASGQVSHFFDDDLVCGSAGVDPALIGRIEPFPTAELVPYDPGYLAGWVVERYRVDLRQASEQSREAMEAAITEMCARAVPGDTHRALHVDAEYHDRTFKHILVPVWLLAYDYGRKRYQVVVNGVTGVIAGQYPLSMWKVALLVLGVVVLVAMVLAASQQ